SLDNYVPAGKSLRASVVPQGGLLSTDLKFPRIQDVKIFRVDSNGVFVLAATYMAEGWEPQEPSFAVAEAFMVEAPVGFLWHQDYPGFPGNPLSISQQPQSQTL